MGVDNSNKGDEINLTTRFGRKAYNRACRLKKGVKVKNSMD